MLSRNDIDFIKQSVLFQGILAVDRDRMIEQCHVHRSAPDTPLFLAGQPVTQVFLVLGGVIELYRGAKHGKHAILGLREVGQIAGASAALAGINHYTTAQPVGSCRLLDVPLSVFKELLERDPNLAAKLTSRLADNLQLISEHVERLQLMQTTERLASYLLSIASNDDCLTELTLPCDKGVIAAYLGMERESFSRALKKLRSLGVVSKGRHIQISDPAALKGLCR